MGFRGIGIWHFVLFSLSLMILLIPTEQANAIFLLPPELSEEELFELNKQEQILRAEQLRDYILDFRHTSSLNPYHDTENVIPYERIFKNNIPITVQGKSDVQQNKLEQIILAQQTLNEIQNGKPISNIYYFEPVSTESFPAFKIDDQTGHMKRTHEDFQIYKAQQIALSEKICEEILKQNRLFVNDQTNNKNQEMKNIMLSPDSKIILQNFEEDTIARNLIQRDDTEFKNLIAEQILLAENKRDQVIVMGLSGLNPYVNEDVLQEELEKPVLVMLEKSNKVFTLPIQNVLYRDNEVFQLHLDKQIELAQITLEGMLPMKNSEKIEDEISDDNKIIIMNGKEIKIPRSYDRDDQGFEFFKNVEIDKAKAKLIELYG